MRHPVQTALLFVTALFTLGACGSDSNSSDNAATATTVESGSSSTNGATATGKVDANKATVAELEAAFEAAGISNAAKWAVEVEEYRPYPTDDPSFAKLRSELAKYNPSPEVLTKILATLSL
jgi:hypothetical protein